MSGKRLRLWEALAAKIIMTQQSGGRSEIHPCAAVPQPWFSRAARYTTGSSSGRRRAIGKARSRTRSAIRCAGLCWNTSVPCWSARERRRCCASEALTSRPRVRRREQRARPQSPARSRLRTSPTSVRLLPHRGGDRRNGDGNRSHHPRGAWRHDGRGESVWREHWVSPCKSWGVTLHCGARAVAFPLPRYSGGGWEGVSQNEHLW